MSMKNRKLLERTSKDRFELWKDDSEPAAAGEPRPAHRPPLPPGMARVTRSYRVAPATAAAIEAESKRTGDSRGQVLDTLAKRLQPKPTGKR